MALTPKDHTETTGHPGPTDRFADGERGDASANLASLSPTPGPGGSRSADTVRPEVVEAIVGVLAGGLDTRVHILGIGGTGMSAIAVILAGMGLSVSGTDQQMSPTVAMLRELGMDVETGSSPSTGLAATSALVARSTAVPDDHPEVLAAISAGVLVARRSEVLAAVTGVIPALAVSGTHGKTTTSGMLASAMDAVHTSTAYLVGSRVANLGAAAHWDPAASHFVVEADESDRTHVALTRSGSIVTNIEAEHLDRYGSAGAVVDAFIEFVRGTNGPRILCSDDPGARFVGEFVRRGGVGADAPVVYYGTGPEAAVRLLDAHPVDGGMRMKVLVDGRELGLRLGVGGFHNALNATSVIALVAALGYDVDAAALGLAEFRGTGRRFEDRGERNGVRFIDDYAHHPTEVAATLNAARQLGRRVVAVFQPHLYSRTRDNAVGFGEALSASDVAVILGVYGAREAPIAGVSEQLVVEAIRPAPHGPASVVSVPDRSAAAAVVAKLLMPGDLCLTLGAGDITNLPDEIAVLWEIEGTGR